MLLVLVAAGCPVVKPGGNCEWGFTGGWLGWLSVTAVGSSIVWKYWWSLAGQERRKGVGCLMDCSGSGDK